MKNPACKSIWAGMVLMSLAGTAGADQRRFAYTYEPETQPQGAMEFEQWVTLRTQRTKQGEVKQQNYNKWELREELEYGVTDYYSLSFYLNFQSESYRDFGVDPAKDVSDFEFKGVSIENRFMVVNPAAAPIGVGLYLEGTFAGGEAEVEEKIIFGQRYGDWKWAFNLSHGTEWEDNFHETEGELEASFGVSRDLGKSWSLGLELRDHNELPEYREWENTAVFLGPVVNYRRENWWATLAVLPQVYGYNFGENPDNHDHLDLAGHERVNVRLLIGIDF